ncbi:MAG TPA: DUF1449 family protein [Campylobacterales bacterium]|nr:DUF1449 family protein [Campylobacterales bacterium]HIP41867.1 DUF1449 family protein [Campylobacterales bacterium]
MPFLAPEMLPYSVAFMIFTLFAFLELTSLILGWGLFDFLDDIFSINHTDIELESTTSLGSFFGYINPQKVPFSMVLVSFFFIFGFTGTLLQNILGLLPLIITLPTVFLVTFILLRHTTNLIGKLLPKETTEVVSTDSFIGKKALILDPIAKKDFPARAKIKDIYDETHYIRVEPFDKADIFVEGDEVIVIEKSNLIFFVEKRLGF